MRAQILTVLAAAAVALACSAPFEKAIDIDAAGAAGADGAALGEAGSPSVGTGGDEAGAPSEAPQAGADGEPTAGAGATMPQGGSSGGTAPHGGSGGTGAAQGGSGPEGGMPSAGSGGTPAAGGTQGGSPPTAGTTSSACEGIADWSYRTFKAGEHVRATCSGEFAGSCPAGEMHEFSCKDPFFCQSKQPGFNNGWEVGWSDLGPC